MLKQKYRIYLLFIALVTLQACGKADSSSPNDLKEKLTQNFMMIHNRLKSIIAACILRLDKQNLEIALFVEWI